MASPTAVIRAASDAGHGLVSRRRLLELGVDASAIARRVRSGELVAVVPGIYRPAGRPLTAELRVRAVMLRLGPDTVLGGRYAAWWHQLVAEPPASVPLLVRMPSQGWHARWPGLVVRRCHLSPADRERRRGVMVTTRALTVLDCAEQPDAGAIRDAALQRGTTTASLLGAVERMSARPGVPAARALIAPVLDGGVSVPERELLRGLRQSGATGWAAGVHVDSGGRRHWLDLAHVRARLAVEVDGWTVHSRSVAFHEDRRRQNDLVRGGWTVLRYTPAQLRGRIPAVVSEIRSVEADLRGRAGAAIGGNVSLSDGFPPLEGGDPPDGGAGSSLPRRSGWICLDSET